MANIEKANKAAERLAGTTRDSYRTIFDHTVALQERNAKFVQGLFDRTAQEVRSQAESNRAVTQELVERAERQRDAFQTVVEESVDAYLDFLYAPLAYYKQGLQLVEGEFSGDISGGSFPIENYDELSVNEISKQLDKLSIEDIKEIRDYERQNKNRDSLIEQLDRKLRAAS
jgi:hypothetical protein